MDIIVEFWPKLALALIGLFTTIAAIRIINVTLGVRYSDKVGELTGLSYAVMHGLQYLSVMIYMAIMLQ